MNNAQQMEKLLGYQFTDISYLESAIDTTTKQFTQFDQFELIGDGFLDGCLSLHLTKLGFNEGQITIAINTLLSNKNLADTIKKLEWYEYLTLDKEDNKTLGDVFEAIIGAIAMDTCGDLRIGVDLIGQIYSMLWADIPLEKDPITQLKEHIEKTKIKITTHTFKSAPKEYTTTIKSHEGIILSMAKAKRKKESIQFASKIALENLTHTYPIAS